MPEEASLHFTRMGDIDLPYGVEAARRTADSELIESATRTLVKIEPDVVAFACSSASFLQGIDGERRIRHVIKKLGVQNAVTTSGAMVDALNALQIRRVAICTPYGEELGSYLIRYLLASGIETVSVVNMDEPTDQILSLNDDEVIALAEESARPDAEAIFLACTNLKTVHLISTLETRLGLPVLSANQVTMWSALQAAGVQASELDHMLFKTKPDTNS